MQEAGLSKEMLGLLEDMLNPVVRAAYARAASAATIMAERKEAFRHAVPPASVAAEGFAGAAADAAKLKGLGRSVRFRSGEKLYAANGVELRQISLGQFS